MVPLTYSLVTGRTRNDEIFSHPRLWYPFISGGHNRVPWGRGSPSLDLVLVFHVLVVCCGLVFVYGKAKKERWTGGL